MKTGFKDLDEIFNIAEPKLILLTGKNNHFISMLSGDIANNICLNQEHKVLEIIDLHKEYLIKRIVVNNANVNYNKWTLKNEYEEEKYTNKELEQIGLAMMNLIETTKELPTIIERKDIGFNLKKIKKFILNYANWYADRDEIETLVVLDISPFNYGIIKSKWKKEYLKSIEKFKSFIGDSNYEFCRYQEAKKFIKNVRKIVKQLRCPIMIVCEEGFLFSKIRKYADTIINVDFVEEHSNIVEIKVEEENRVKTCKLNYDGGIRKFESI